MASTTETSKKADNKSNPLKKVGAFFKRVVFGFINSFRNMSAELKKVSWPTRIELRNYSLVVLVFMVFMGIVIGIIDAGSALVSNWIINA